MSQSFWNSHPVPLYKLLQTFLVFHFGPGVPYDQNNLRLAFRVKFPADLATYTKEILNGKLYFLCSEICLLFHVTFHGKPDQAFSEIV